MTASLEAEDLRLDRVRGDLRLDEAECSIAGVPFNQRVPTRDWAADLPAIHGTGALR